jgi:sarcosine oxidase subunit alpha
MPPAIVSRRIADPPTSHHRGHPVHLSLEGKSVRGYAGESVAAALYASDSGLLSRSIKYHRPRSFFCLEGHCGGCLMRIGGVPNLRACMEPCRDGLTITRQNAYPSAELDVLGAVDWMFPGGMDHHTLFTGSRLLNAMTNKVVRQLSGLGTLPDAAPLVVAPIADRRVDVVVVGGGPAGLAAARCTAESGLETLLVDEQDRPGGTLLADPRHGVAEAERRTAELRGAGAEILSRATALAYYPEDRMAAAEEPGLLALATPDRLVRLRARRYIYATGSYPVNRPFVNNDRPGVLAARAVARLLVRHRILAGNRICVLGDDPLALTLAPALRAAGAEVVAVDGTRQRLLGVRGQSWVRAVELVDADGHRSRVECDAVAVSATPAPASDAPRQHGCAVAFAAARGGFAVLADDDGRTSVAGVLACGDVCGYVGPAAATEAGQRAGAEVSRQLGAGGTGGGR